MNTPSSDEEHEVSTNAIPLFARAPIITSQRLTSEKMMEFLNYREEHECRVAVFYTTVCQKSYGQERRFFCPPPCVYLLGQGWKLKKQRMSDYYKSLKLDEDTIREEQSAELVGYVVVGNNNGEKYPLDFSTAKIKHPGDLKPDSKIYDYSAARAVTICNSDKRKCLYLNVQLFFGCGMEIGQFLTKRIKVISKPSKVKLTMKEGDGRHMSQFIVSGSKVALFNRQRNSGSFTKFLHVEGGTFRASAIRWGAFSIHLCDEEREPDLFSTRDGFIHFGSTIKLVDSTTGISLPKLRIRKVEKDQVILDDARDEPTSQLQRCAFQMVDNEEMYLCRRLHDIILQRADRVSEKRHKVSDEVIWTIISADTAEFRFYEAMGTVSTPVTPCPVVKAIEVIGIGRNSRVVLLGKDFQPNLKVWFGATEVDTIFESGESMVCKVPAVGTVARSETFSSGWKGDVETPISLVRDDGVIYPTDLSFSYKSLDTLPVQSQEFMATYFDL